MATETAATHSLGSLVNLPLEIRLLIYRYVFSPTPVNSLRPLGFGNPPRACDVFFTLPAKDLKELYVQNPAGYGRGPFWKRTKLSVVSKQVAREALREWDERVLVHVGSWLSFLQERPRQSLSGIVYVQFRYWIRGKWEPATNDALLGNPLEHWVNEFMDDWERQIRQYAQLVGPKTLARTTIDLTLTQPPMLTYRIAPTEEERDIPKLMREVLATVLDQLMQFREKKQWPSEEIVLPQPNVRHFRGYSKSALAFDLSTTRPSYPTAWGSQNMSGS